MKNFKHFYEGTYAKYILPGVLLQSVLIGGGYATGREIYSYGAKFGALGWISGLTIGIGFACLLSLPLRSAVSIRFMITKTISKR